MVFYFEYLELVNCRENVVIVMWSNLDYFGIYFVSIRLINLYLNIRVKWMRYYIEFILNIYIFMKLVGFGNLICFLVVRLIIKMVIVGLVYFGLG